MKKVKSSSRLKRYLIAGFLVWIPALITLFFVRVLIGWVDSVLLMIPASYQPKALIGHSLPGIGFLVVLVVLFFTGLFITNVIGKKLLAFWEALLDRIPMIRTIYTGVKQTMKMILSPKGKSFRQVVLVEYPRRGLWSLAFLTNESGFGEKGDDPVDYYTIFIPTTPNPTSGYLIYVSKDQVKLLDIPVDEGIRLVISLGTSQVSSKMDVSQLIASSEDVI